MTKTQFEYFGKHYNFDMILTGKSYRAMMGEKTVNVEIIRAEAEHGKLDLLIDGKHIIAYVSSDGARRWVTVDGQTFVLTKSTAGARKSSGHDHASELAAPMPGVVRSVNVSEGESVSKGQTLLVLEAMKMEIRIQAKSDGMVSSLQVKAGQIVERGQILVELDNG